MRHFLFRLLIIMGIVLPVGFSYGLAVSAQIDYADYREVRSM
jgi:hypothetical protein